MQRTTFLALTTAAASLAFAAPASAGSSTMPTVQVQVVVTAPDESTPEGCFVARKAEGKTDQQATEECGGGAAVVEGGSGFGGIVLGKGGRDKAEQVGGCGVAPTSPDPTGGDEIGAETEQKETHWYDFLFEDDDAGAGTDANSDVQVFNPDKGSGSTTEPKEKEWSIWDLFGGKDEGTKGQTDATKTVGGGVLDLFNKGMGGSTKMPSGDGSDESPTIVCDFPDQVDDPRPECTDGGTENTMTTGEETTCAGGFYGMAELVDTLAEELYVQCMSDKKPAPGETNVCDPKDLGEGAPPSDAPCSDPLAYYPEGCGTPSHDGGWAPPNPFGRAMTARFGDTLSAAGVRFAFTHME